MLSGPARPPVVKALLSMPVHHSSYLWRPARSMPLLTPAGPETMAARLLSGDRRGIHPVSGVPTGPDPRCACLLGRRVCRFPDRAPPVSPSRSRQTLPFVPRLGYNPHGPQGSGSVQSGLPGGLAPAIGGSSCTGLGRQKVSPFCPPLRGWGVSPAFRHKFLPSAPRFGYNPDSPRASGSAQVALPDGAAPAVGGLSCARPVR
jgi:hypothetical protein